MEKILLSSYNEIGVLQVEKKIRSRVKRQMDKTQKEYYLNEQIKAIQKELGETSDPKDEIAEIEQKLKKLNLSDEAREKVKAEIKSIDLVVTFRPINYLKTLLVLKLMH